MATERPGGETAAMQKGLRWLILLRFVGVVGGFLVVAIHAGNTTGGKVGVTVSEAFQESGILFIFLAIVGALNGYYFAIQERVRAVERFILYQLFTDTFVLAALLYLTGGPGSLFTHFYFAVILAAGLLGPSRSSLVFAALASALLAAIVIVFAVLPLEQLPFLRPSWQVKREIDIDYFVSFLLIPVVAFFLVAVLSNSLAARFSTLRLMNDRVLRSMAEAVIICDRDAQVVMFNREARTLFGFPDDRQLEGGLANEVFKRDTDEEIRAILTTSEESQRELALPRRNGSVTPLLAKSSVIRDYHGEPLAVVCLFSDLSLRRLAEEGERRIERLEGIRQMAAAIAQELRQILTSIDPLLAEMERFGKKKDVQRFRSLVDEFLDFSKRGELEFVETNVAELAKDVVSVLKDRFTARNKYEIRMDAPEVLSCYCDPEHVRRAIHHLAQNALEAMHNGGRLFIRGQAQQRQSPTTGGVLDGVLLEFYDEGAGIPDDAVEKVFDPFFTTKKDAAGLGLSIVRSTVSAHGGEVSFQSRVGYGSTFILWLPSDPRPKGVPEASPGKPAPAAKSKDAVA